MESRLETLKWLADATKLAIAEAPVDRKAPLIAQARGIAAEIAELTKNADKVGDPIDEIAARRSARGGSTARSGRAARGSV